MFQIKLYRVLIAGENNSNKCIGKIMSATITKDVEIKYSGTGRQIRGVGKKNFILTMTFKCLKGKFNFK